MSWQRVFENPVEPKVEGRSLTDLEWKLLNDLRLPHGRRKVVPLGTLVIDRKLEEMSRRGWVQWVQADPVYTSLANDHYELTPEGHLVIESYREWVRDLGRPKRDQETSVARAARKIREIRAAHGGSLQLAARIFASRYERLAYEVMDRVGSWPSSEPEIRALQKVWR